MFLKKFVDICSVIFILFSERPKIGRFFVLFVYFRP